MHREKNRRLHQQILRVFPRPIAMSSQINRELINDTERIQFISNQGHLTDRHEGIDISIKAECWCGIAGNINRWASRVVQLGAF